MDPLFREVIAAADQCAVVDEQTVGKLTGECEGISLEALQLLTDEHETVGHVLKRLDLTVSLSLLLDTHSNDTHTHIPRPPGCRLLLRPVHHLAVVGPDLQHDRTQGVRKLCVLYEAAH